MDFKSNTSLYSAMLGMSEMFLQSTARYVKQIEERQRNRIQEIEASRASRQKEPIRSSNPSMYSKFAVSPERDAFFRILIDSDTPVDSEEDNDDQEGSEDEAEDSEGELNKNDGEEVPKEAERAELPEAAEVEEEKKDGLLNSSKKIQKLRSKWIRRTTVGLSQNNRLGIGLKKLIKQEQLLVKKDQLLLKNLRQEMKTLKSRIAKRQAPIQKMKDILSNLEG